MHENSFFRNRNIFRILLEKFHLHGKICHSLDEHPFFSTKIWAPAENQHQTQDCLFIGCITGKGNPTFSCLRPFVVSQLLVSCKGLQAKYIIRGLQGKMRIGLSVPTVMGKRVSPLCGSRQRDCIPVDSAFSLITAFSKHYPFVPLQSWKGKQNSLLVIND